MWYLGDGSRSVYNVLPKHVELGLSPLGKVSCWATFHCSLFELCFTLHSYTWPTKPFSPLWVNTVQNFPSFSPSFLLPSPKGTRKNVKDANSKQHVPKEDLEFALVKSRLVLQADGSCRVQDHSLFGIIVLP